MKKANIVSVYLPAILAGKLEVYAERHYTTKSAVVRNAVKEFLGGE